MTHDKYLTLFFSLHLLFIKMDIFITSNVQKKSYFLKYKLIDIDIYYTFFYLDKYHFSLK